VTRTTARRPLAAVHRIGAVVLGLVLWVFGILGLVDQLGYFETTGTPVMGLNTNGLLSTVSLVVGAVLIASGVRGGRTASTVTAVVGGLFILSGLVNLGVLNTSANILAFTIANVFFSLVAGVVLLTMGLYGRVSGGLAADNPYRQEREVRAGTAGQPVPDAARLAELEALSLAEQLVAEGRGTPEQEAAVAADRQRRAQLEHDRAWAHARRTGQVPVGSTEPTA
jgi:hypothetical protein